MVTLQAFVDDSASDSGDRRLFLAGYINGADQWAAFSDAWLLKLREPPKIDYFKMKEAQNLSGQFKGWSEIQRDKKVMTLAGLVREHRFWSVHCSVSRADYAKFLTPVAPMPLKSPYGLCFWGIIQLAAQYHSSLGIEGVPPVDFIFDEQGGLGDDAAIFYPWLKEGQNPAIRDLLGATPVFRDDKQVVALQAADMLAWHLRRNHERGGTENRPAMELLISDGQHAFKDLDAAVLQHLAKGMGRVPGLDLLQDKGSWRRTRKMVRAEVAAGLPPPRIDFFRMRVFRLVLRVRGLLDRLRYPRR